MGWWYASSQDIGASAIAFGLLSIIAVVARVYLARKRHLRLRSHDVLIVITLIPVLALCVWDALAGFSSVLDGIHTNGVFFTYRYRNGEVNSRGLSAMMLMHVFAALFLVCSTFEFCSKLFRWKRDNLFVRLPLFFVGAGYGAAAAYLISALFFERPGITAGFILGVAILDIVMVLSIVIIPGFMRKRLPLGQLNSSKLVGAYLFAAFLVASATAFLVFSVYYLENFFGSDDPRTFATLASIRVYYAEQYYYSADLTLWGLLTVTMWTITACIPTFAPEIQQLSNQDPYAQQWPQQPYWQQPDPVAPSGPMQPIQQDLYA